MMFEYLGWHEVGQLITNAMESLFQSGKATADLARLCKMGNHYQQPNLLKPLSIIYNSKGMVNERKVLSL